MDTPITRAEHEEFVRRMEAENKRLADEDNRQNHRIDGLEETMRQIGDLTASVKELAVSMKNMAKLQEQQGKDIDELKNRDGHMWRMVVSHIATTIAGAIVMYALTQIGM